jgi:hypothetical protein
MEAWPILRFYPGIFLEGLSKPQNFDTFFCVKLNFEPRIKLVNIPNKSLNHSTMTFSNSDLENQYSAAIGNPEKIQNFSVEG